jgi:hypothetical protein
LDIREENDVHESLKDAIEFNGVQYWSGVAMEKGSQTLAK